MGDFWHGGAGEADRGLPNGAGFAPWGEIGVCVVLRLWGGCV